MIMLINILGLLLIGLIIWWFWLYQPADIPLKEGTTNISVEAGIYSPSTVRVPAGKNIILVFTRLDETPCASTVVFPDLEISVELPVGVATTIELPPLTPGDYKFCCQMNMYQGKLIVVDAA